MKKGLNEIISLKSQSTEYLALLEYNANFYV